MFRKIAIAAALLAVTAVTACGQPAPAGAPAPVAQSGPAPAAAPAPAPPAASLAGFCAGLVKLGGEDGLALAGDDITEAVLDEKLRQITAIAPPDLAADIATTGEVARLAIRGEKPTPQQFAAMQAASEHFLAAVKSCNS